MKVIRLIILCAVCVSCFAAQVQATNESQAAVLLLLIEPGAKQAGMGEAYTAVSDDASAGYYNPAGLAFQDRNLKNLQFMHTNWLPALADDIYYEYMGYSQYAEGWGHFAFNVVYFNLGEQNRTSSVSSDIIGKFHSFEVVASGSYGATMTDNLSLGLTLKAIYSKLAEAGQEAEKGKGIGTSFALDFGAMYKTPVDGLSLAAVIHNMGPKISYIDVTQADPLPLNFIFGAAYVPIHNEFNKLSFVADIYKPLVRRNGSPVEALVKGWYDESNEFEQIDYKVGTEYVYNNFMALRAGYTYDKDGELKSPTFGVGITWDKILVDLAYYAGRDNPMQDSMRFSFAYNF
ncbi:PorV/PorQ family protein [bacterium]|nr:PorV/PorQ family protein [bacterium]